MQAFSIWIQNVMMLACTYFQMIQGEKKERTRGSKGDKMETAGESSQLFCSLKIFNLQMGGVE